MIIEKFTIVEHESIDAIFTFQKEEDKIILKNILANLFLVQFTTLYDCKEIDNLELLKYNFKFNYHNNKYKEFIKIE